MKTQFTQKVISLKIKAAVVSKPNDSLTRGFGYFLEHTMYCILVNLSCRLTVLKKEMSPRLIMKYVVANSWQLSLKEARKGFFVDVVCAKRLKITKKDI